MHMHVVCALLVLSFTNNHAHSCATTMELSQKIQQNMCLFGVQILQNSISAGAPHRTPLGSVRCSPTLLVDWRGDTPSSLPTPRRHFNVIVNFMCTTIDDVTLNIIILKKPIKLLHDLDSCHSKHSVLHRLFLLVGKQERFKLWSMTDV